MKQVVYLYPPSKSFKQFSSLRHRIERFQMLRKIPQRLFTRKIFQSFPR
jgi:hypothetical protein